MSQHLIHRGLINKNFQVNTIKAFKHSFTRKYGIETDIHATKDHEFICFHDFTLNRIIKKKASVKNMQYSQIKKISNQNKKPIPLLGYEAIQIIIDFIISLCNTKVKQNVKISNLYIEIKFF